MEDTVANNTQAPIAQPQPQPLPQPQAAPVVQQQLAVVPALQGISNYFAMGTSQAGSAVLYSYDIVLSQWRVAQPNEVERMALSMGIPNNVLQAMKTFRF